MFKIMGRAGQRARPRASGIKGRKKNFFFFVGPGTGPEGKNFFFVGPGTGPGRLASQGWTAMVERIVLMALAGTNWLN